MKMFLKIFLILILFRSPLNSQTAPNPETLQSPPVSSTFKPPAINVIYPKDSQSVSVSDSTFILGNVSPGSSLKINGFPVKVYHNGAFLAFLPLSPGDFTFELIATNKDRKST